MHLEAALNLIWALVGVVALGLLGVAELRRGVATLRSRCRRCIAVLIATVALFPCISASDDMVCLELLHTGSFASAQLSKAHFKEVAHQAAFSLALQLESLENFQISYAKFSVATLSQSDRVAQRVVRCCDRPLPSRADRGPPLHSLSV